MINDMKIPQVNVNEDRVTFVEWFVKEGDRVKRGAPLCSVETSKAVVELEAEADGYVRHCTAETGKEIPVHTTICYITEKKNEPITVSGKKKSKQPTRAGYPAATEKAAKRAAQLGVDLSLISKKGVIREKDVQAYVDAAADGAAGRRDTAVTAGPGRLDAAFFTKVLTDKGFRGLASGEKVELYRKNGATIGKDVTLGAGSVIVAEAVGIGDGVSIGEGTVLEADTVSIGTMSTIGKDCELVSGMIALGDGTTVADRVTADLSGGKCAASKIVTGKQCLIAMEVYLNTSRSVVLGDHVALSPRAMIYTHRYWQSVLEGYPVSFAGVVIEKNAWIGSASQVLPGITVGEGSTIMSNSLVVSHVPAHTLAGGVPAAVIKRDLKKHLSPDRQEGILRSLIDEFADGLRERKCVVTVKESAPGVRYTVTVPSREATSTIVLVLGDHPIDPRKEDTIYVTMRGVDVPGDARATVFDVKRTRVTGPGNGISDELRNFLRRRGIVFTPLSRRNSIGKGL